MNDSSDLRPDNPSAATRPPLSELFVSFVIVSISGFGGALPWVLVTFVQERVWLKAGRVGEAFTLS